jgi:hypothetical protein
VTFTAPEGDTDMINDTGKHRVATNAREIDALLQHSPKIVTQVGMTRVSASFDGELETEN